MEPLDPPAGSAIGDRVTVEGFPGSPDEELNPKKKVWETVQPDFLTNDDLVATYKGVPLATPRGPLTTASLKGAPIK